MSVSLCDSALNVAMCRWGEVGQRSEHEGLLPHPELRDLPSYIYARNYGPEGYSYIPAAC